MLNVSAYHGRPEPQQRWYGCENLKISGEWRHKPPRRKCCTGLIPGTGVATALTRHLLFLCVLSTFLASFDWDTLARLCSEPESRLVERCNHYCLHSTVASASFITCFTDLWITLYLQWEGSWFLILSCVTEVFIFSGISRACNTRGDDEKYNIIVNKPQECG